MSKRRKVVETRQDVVKKFRKLRRAFEDEVHLRLWRLRRAYGDTGATGEEDAPYRDATDELQAEARSLHELSKRLNDEEPESRLARKLQVRLNAMDHDFKMLEAMRSAARLFANAAPAAE